MVCTPLVSPGLPVVRRVSVIPVRIRVGSRGSDVSLAAAVTVSTAPPLSGFSVSSQSGLPKPLPPPVDSSVSCCGYRSLMKCQACLSPSPGLALTLRL